MANEFTGSGVTLGFNTVGAPSVYTTLAGVTRCDVPTLTSDDIEVTALDSTAKEYITGLGDGGDVTFDVNLRKATAGSAPWVASQTAFEAYNGDQILHGFEITFPGATDVVYTFNGYVKEFKIEVGGANVATTASGVIKVSGAIVKS